MGFLDRLLEFLTVMGVPGLLVISFLDSAAVPLPGGPDAVVLLLAWHKPAMILPIVLAATIGSTAGCLVLYGIGKKGGGKALSGFSPKRRAHVEQRVQENGAWVILGSVLAPPPFPTKLVILASGVACIGRIRLASAVFLGRLLRYSLEGYVGARYGEKAAQVIEARYLTFSLVLVGAIFLIILTRALARRRRPTDV